ncbi:MAG: hypothetical protein HY315_10585 [Acidobacteria bacterium]|nr:hypothetical protein [Acidobacteriota bacterium]
MAIVSILIGVMIEAAVFYRGLRSQRKKAHHLEGLHVAPSARDRADGLGRRDDRMTPMSRILRTLLVAMLTGACVVARTAHSKGILRTLLVVVLMGAAAASGEASGLRGKVTCSGVKDNSDVVVYLDRAPDQPVKDYSLPTKDTLIDQLNLTFVPHVLPALKGTRVAFPNSDEVRHSVFSPSKTKRFNLGTYPKGTIKHVVFDQPGVVALLCNVHAEMSAYVIVTETPYFATTDKQGRYEIGNISPGQYLLRAWHEKLPPLSRKVVVEKDGFTVVDLEMKR